LEQPIWFVPGRPAPPEGLLARYRPLVPVGAAAEYVHRLTAPGDLVLDLFCGGPVYVREAVRAGRRALGISVNPVSLLTAAQGLEPPPDSPSLNAAFTRLADSPKGNVPLHRHMTALYATRCPQCDAEGVAEWFAWDREARSVYAKAVRCSSCEGAREGPTDEADVEAARWLERRGLAYHYALDRVAPAGHAARQRAAELIDLYTPRNLSALMDIALRLDGMELTRPVRAALQGLLLSAFDRGSSLDPHGKPRPRPRILRVPARYVERNVWLILEEGLAELAVCSEGGGGTATSSQPPVRRAAGLSALLEERTPAYFLLPCSARDAGRLLEARSVSLILADPPRPDGVFWALSALWAGWLWGSPLAHALRPFLGRRRFDWEWHHRALRAALMAAVPLLAAGGHLLTLFVEPDEGLLESVCLAAAAGYRPVGWGASPGEGARLVWTADAGTRDRPQPPVQADTEDLQAGGGETGDSAGSIVEAEKELVAAAARTVRACLQGRAEPTPWMILHAAVYAGLAGAGPRADTAHPPGQEQLSGVLAARVPSPLALVAGCVRQGWEQLGLEQVAEEPELYWLPALDADSAVEPLADRVEEAVRQALEARHASEVGDVILSVYAVLDGSLTPELSLVLLCLDSYAVAGKATWRMRQEDDPERRAQEMKALEEGLSTLGARLGFQVQRGQGWAVRWQEEGQDVFLFALSPTAALGRHLLSGPAISEGARPCLVSPGGRAELLAHKLRRDPRLGRVVEEKAWQFVKFRHLRRLVAEALDRRLFEAVLGLDPIVEREGVQIPLILGGD
jgi:hypothetical protein